MGFLTIWKGEHERFIFKVCSEDLLLMKKRFDVVDLDSTFADEEILS